jgi:hypothetical protein
VTDIAQPLHTSVHLFSWNQAVPNPHGYKPDNIHRSIEAFADQCIREQRIAEPQVAKRLSPPRRIADWLSDIVKQIEDGNKHVELVFALEQKGLLKSCAKESEAVAFVTSQLAAGSSVLRDVWHSAWVRSASK